MWNGEEFLLTHSWSPLSPYNALLIRVFVFLLQAFPVPAPVGHKEVCPCSFTTEHVAHRFCLAPPGPQSTKAENFRAHCLRAVPFHLSVHPSTPLPGPLPYPEFLHVSLPPIKEPTRTTCLILTPSGTVNNPSLFFRPSSLPSQMEVVMINGDFCPVPLHTINLPMCSFYAAPHVSSEAGRQEDIERFVDGSLPIATSDSSLQTPPLLARATRDTGHLPHHILGPSNWTNASRLPLEPTKTRVPDGWPLFTSQRILAYTMRVGWMRSATCLQQASDRPSRQQDS